MQQLQGDEKVDAHALLNEGRMADWDSLDLHEKLWLRDQSLLTADQERELEGYGVTFGHGNPSRRVSNDPNIIAETQLKTSALFDQLVEERARELAKDMLLAQQQGGLNVSDEPTTGRVGNAPVQVTPGVAKPYQPPSSSEEGFEEAPPYEEWDAKELRAELQKRELHSSGSKAEMISRLEEDDAKDEGEGEGE